MSSMDQQEKSKEKKPMNPLLMAFLTLLTVYNIYKIYNTFQSKKRYDQNISNEIDSRYFLSNGNESIKNVDKKTTLYLSDSLLIEPLLTKHKIKKLANDTLIPLFLGIFEMKIPRGYYVQNLYNDTLYFSLKSPQSDIFNIYALQTNKKEESIIEELKTSGIVSKIKKYNPTISSSKKWYAYEYEVDEKTWNGMASLQIVEGFASIISIEHPSKSKQLLHEDLLRFMKKMKQTTPLPSKN